MATAPPAGDRRKMSEAGLTNSTNADLTNRYMLMPRSVILDIASSKNLPTLTEQALIQRYGPGDYLPAKILGPDTYRKEHVVYCLLRSFTDSRIDTTHKFFCPASEARRWLENDPEVLMRNQHLSQAAFNSGLMQAQEVDSTQKQPEGKRRTTLESGASAVGKRRSGETADDGADPKRAKLDGLGVPPGTIMDQLASAGTANALLQLLAAKAPPGLLKPDIPPPAPPIPQPGLPPALQALANGGGPPPFQNPNSFGGGPNPLGPLLVHLAAQAAAQSMMPAQPPPNLGNLPNMLQSMLPPQQVAALMSAMQGGNNLPPPLPSPQAQGGMKPSDIDAMLAALLASKPGMPPPPSNLLGGPVGPRQSNSTLVPPPLLSPAKQPEPARLRRYSAWGETEENTGGNAESDDEEESSKSGDEEDNEVYNIDPTICGLPSDWKVIRRRHTGNHKRAGQLFTSYISPDGRKLRSHPKALRYLAQLQKQQAHAQQALAAAKRNNTDDEGRNSKEDKGRTTTNGSTSNQLAHILSAGGVGHSTSSLLRAATIAALHQKVQGGKRPTEEGGGHEEGQGLDLLAAAAAETDEAVTAPGNGAVADLKATVTLADGKKVELQLGQVSGPLYHQIIGGYVQHMKALLDKQQDGSPEPQARADTEELVDQLQSTLQ